MRAVVEPGSQAEQVGRLLIAVVVVLALPALPFGTYLIYPFVILTTWFHEMGHGISALLVGQDFQRLLIYANGSGVAESLVDTDASRLTQAAIAAGGPLAPCIAGAGLILASAHRKLWRGTLVALAGVIFASVIVYVRSEVGIAVLPLVGALLVLIAWKAPDGFARFSLQFLGVLAAMSMLRDFNYLFTEQAVINGRRILSDTGQIEASLFLPHWFWAGAIIAASALMIGLSLKYALRDIRPGGPKRKPPANVLQFRRPGR
ncbi:M50 family metallopeptidase [Erythrobacter sp. JK5]|uniref:M50 family metallopeptidase n=1 Tax=Erythrobacter sp. JK5 TaxID=2829500 RepID=UPI001BADF5DE|nr:M50 family metallopeptidase [Erythrobacter sp. JK5]QUL37055.1 M50 family metallopeptidase [Erythrobacter sp. JK5]